MTDVFAETLLLAYRGGGRLAAPLIGWVLDARARRGKEDPARRGERFGYASHARPEGALVWVHAASVGETMSVLPVIEWLTRSGVAVVLTSGTVTSATLAAPRLPAGAIHQYVPLDIPSFIGRFLDHWRPDAAFFVESEVWPTTIVELNARQIPLALINGRLSAPTLRRWLKAPRLARSIFERYRLVIAQSEADAERFSHLGVKDLRVSGNIKYDCRPLPADMVELARLRHLIGERPLLLAASTHTGEEVIIADALRQMREAVPGLLSIIVPRYPHRRDEVAAVLQQRGLKTAIRSMSEELEPETDVYLADTMGELGIFYRLANVAFIGGTLGPVGGHNPIEAAQLETAVLHGPQVQNARPVFAALDAGGAALLVSDASSFAAAAIQLLTSPAAAEAMAKAGTEIVATGRGALDLTRRFLEATVIPDLFPTMRGHADETLGQASA